MKIIEKTIMKDGTKILLTDWSEHNTKNFPNFYGLQIHAYPIAKKTSKYKIIKQNNKFLLVISMNTYCNYTNEDVLADFKALKMGVKTLEDLSNHFWNGKKDMYYLGMDVDYQE